MVAIAEYFWKMQRKTWYSILGVDDMPLSLKKLLLKSNKIAKFDTYIFNLSFFTMEHLVKECFHVL